MYWKHSEPSGLNTLAGASTVHRESGVGSNPTTFTQTNLK